MDWQDISTAPRNGEDLLLYREDAGIFFGRWTAPIHILTERELERENLSEESANEEGWFFLDVVSGARCDEPPTHWMPLPSPPVEKE